MADLNDQTLLVEILPATRFQGGLEINLKLEKPSELLILRLAY